MGPEPARSTDCRLTNNFMGRLRKCVSRTSRDVRLLTAHGPEKAFKTWYDAWRIDSRTGSHIGRARLGPVCMSLSMMDGRCRLWAR
jgi:hypothetical protein